MNLNNWLLCTACGSFVLLIKGKFPKYWFSYFMGATITVLFVKKKHKTDDFKENQISIIFLTYRDSETVMVVFYKKKLSKWNPALKARWKIQNRQGFILASINFRLAKRDRVFVQSKWEKHPLFFNLFEAGNEKHLKNQENDQSCLSGFVWWFSQSNSLNIG